MRKDIEKCLQGILKQQGKKIKKKEKKEDIKQKM